MSELAVGIGAVPPDVSAESAAVCAPIGSIERDLDIICEDQRKIGQLLVGANVEHARGTFCADVELMRHDTITAVHSTLFSSGHSVVTWFEIEAGWKLVDSPLHLGGNYLQSLVLPRIPSSSEAAEDVQCPVAEKYPLVVSEQGELRYHPAVPIDDRRRQDTQKAREQVVSALSMVVSAFDS